MTKQIGVIGAGAAGIFGAIRAKELNKMAHVVVLERTQECLGKVRISGGGRCNVTHAEFDPKRLVQNYPRGAKELLGSFYRFQPEDTVRWFLERGVVLKKEEDGRMFPITDSSETIITCLLGEAKRLGVEIIHGVQIQKILSEQERFTVQTAEKEWHFDQLLVATGSQPFGHQVAKSFGHTIVEPVPSLFTFNVPSSPLLPLTGLSIDARIGIDIAKERFEQTGPVLLTHWGFSGPAVIKLSAWAARHLHAVDYRAPFWIDWTKGQSLQSTFMALKRLKSTSHSTIARCKLLQCPQRLWEQLIIEAKIDPDRTISHLSDAQLQGLAEKLTHDVYQMEGKTRFKEEFVTAGGVLLKEIDLKTMESRLIPGLHFAGEIIDVDGVTGGFNFQNAWTTSWLAATHMAERT